MTAHKNHTHTFNTPPNSLSYAEQARSFNAAMAWCSKAARAHINRAAQEGRDVEAVREKCVSQVQRLLARIERL
jgi:hypothetical protein